MVVCVGGVRVGRREGGVSVRGRGLRIGRKVTRLRWEGCM